MRVLVAGVYSYSGSFSLAAHSCFAEVDRHSDSEAVGGAAVADFAAVAASVGSELLVDSVKEVCCLGPCCLGNPSPCGPKGHI